MFGVRRTLFGIRRRVRKIVWFCLMVVLFGVGRSHFVGCFVRPPTADLVVYGVLFELDVLFEYGDLFGVLFAEKTFDSFSQVWAEQSAFSLNVVRVQS